MKLIIRVLNRDTIADRYPDAVDIEKKHPLSNQWKIGPPQGWSRGETIARYDEWLEDNIRKEDPRVTAALEELGGILMEKGELNLLCSCAPATCHGHIIQRALKEAINGYDPSIQIECS